MRRAVIKASLLLVGAATFLLLILALNSGSPDRWVQAYALESVTWYQERADGPYEYKILRLKQAKLLDLVNKFVSGRGQATWDELPSGMTGSFDERMSLMIGGGGCMIE